MCFLSLSSASSLSLLCLCLMVTFVCHGWRTETDVSSAACLWISLCLHDCDSHCLVPHVGRPLKPAFHPPLLLLLLSPPPLPTPSLPPPTSLNLSVRRLRLLRVRPIKLLHSHRPPVSRPATR